MKKNKPFVAAAICFAATFLPVTGSAQVSVPANAGGFANYVGWNAAQLFPLPIQHQGNQPINISTNLFRRMTVTAGGNAFGDGRVGMGNNLPAAFVPQARLHLYNDGNAINNVNGVLMNSQFAGQTATDGFFIGRVENPVLGTGQTFFTNFEPNNPMVFYTHDPISGVLERFRIQPNGTGVSPGYIGVNNSNPRFHMDMITPAFLGGELFYSARPSDVLNSTMGLCNGAFNNSVFLPIFFGNVDASQAGPGIQTVGNVDPSQDNAANFASVVTRFVSSQGWVFNTTGLGNLANRHLFSWSNANSMNMLMNVQGQLRVMENLNASTDVPNNRVEITASATDPYGSVIAVNGASGLRLTHLTSLKTPMTNPGQGVLSVDSTGDVIYVPGGGGGCCLGNVCSLQSNPLTSGWEIPMNRFNFIFADPIATLNDNENFVGIGGFGCTPRAKLDVFRDFTNNGLSMVVGAYVENNDIASSTPYSLESQGTYSVAHGANKGNYGVVGEAYNAGANIGVKGYAAEVYAGGTSAFQNYGTQGIAIDGLLNTGVYGSASGTNPNSVSHYGGYFTATTSNNNAMNQNIAVYGSASNNQTMVNDNVSAYNYTINFDNTFNNLGSFNYALNVGTNANNNVGVVGIADDVAGTAANSIGVYGEGIIAGYFAGPLLGAMPPIIFSDNKIKTDVKQIDNGLEILNQLNPVTYHYKTEEFPELHLDHNLQYGFIAQEVEKVLPDLVKETKKPEFKDLEGKVISKGGEFKGIAYDGIIPILTKSIQEQQEQIAAQQKQIDELTQMVKQLMPDAQPGSHSQNQHDVELTDKNVVILNQNVPNPFAESTIITYQLPENYNMAQMQFYNAGGQLIKTVDIHDKGQGQINVFANDLSNGTYTYSLVVDGKIIDSKRMVRSK